jgi:hypothetical protein
VETDRSGYSGTGYIRWAGENLYVAGGQGSMYFSFIPDVSGVYEVTIRARAIAPPRSDLNNDVWMRMNGQRSSGSSDFSDWVKVFTTGGDSWTLGGTVDSGELKEPFQQYLQAGTLYTLEISGRSSDYALDYLEISSR